MAALLAARNLALYLLSLVALASAAIAWSGAAPLLLLRHAGTLAAAVLLGQLLADALSGVGAGPVRRRARLFVLAGFALAGLLAVTVALAGPPLARRAVEAFALLQPLALLLADLLALQGAALVGALVLTVLAATSGGLPAAVAVTAFVGLLAFFLAFDHAARRLLARPSAPARLLPPVAKDAARTVAPVLLALAAFLWLVPESRPAGGPVRRSFSGSAPGSYSRLEDPRRSYEWLAGLGVAGAALIFSLGRLFGGKAPAPLTEVVETQVEAEEPLEPAVVDEGRYGPGRGRVIRAYVRFLGRARAAGLSVAAHLTPREIEAHVRPPPDALALLTSLFMNSRYGPDEPSPEEVRAAERAAREASSGLPRGRRRRRPA